MSRARLFPILALTALAETWEGVPQGSKCERGNGNVDCDAGELELCECSNGWCTSPALEKGKTGCVTLGGESKSCSEGISTCIAKEAIFFERYDCCASRVHPEAISTAIVSQYHEKAREGKNCARHEGTVSCKGSFFYNICGCNHELCVPTLGDSIYCVTDSDDFKCYEPDTTFPTCINNEIDDFDSYICCRPELNLARVVVWLGILFFWIPCICISIGIIRIVARQRTAARDGLKPATASGSAPVDGVQSVAGVQSAPPVVVSSSTAESAPIGASTKTPTGRLSELKGFKDSGLISEEQFNTKRDEILKDI
jgi:hypothetical protein